jgi:hypothetical protein
VLNTLPALGPALSSTVTMLSPVTGYGTWSFVSSPVMLPARETGDGPRLGNRHRVGERAVAALLSSLSTRVTRTKWIF